MDQRSPEQRSMSENIQSCVHKLNAYGVRNRSENVFGNTLRVIALWPHNPLLLHVTDLYNCYLNV